MSETIAVPADPIIVLLKRVFMLGSTRLLDPDPTRSPDQVRDLYSANYPFLANAHVTEGEVRGDEMVFTFEKNPVETKG